MKNKGIGPFILAYFLIGLTMGGALLAAVTPVRANPGWFVGLDADSTSQTDATVTASASQSHSFKVGAVINASSTAPLNGVFGWQFTINYNATAFTPQGDPRVGSQYPDRAGPTELFGGQTSPGSPNWADLIFYHEAFGSSTLTGPGQITVFFTVIGPSPTVNIQAKTLLANVNFELLSSQQADPQSFTVSNVLFVDSSASLIPGVIAGPGASETVINEPPQARFTATPAPNISTFAFTFDATASFDPDGSIPNPGGFFWDFGDGTPHSTPSGPVVTHDYGASGRFQATLMVQDNLGTTGSARDSEGNVLTNSQPSHASLNISVQPPVARFTYSPSIASVGQPVTFDGSGSSDPDGIVLSWTWKFGDGSLPVQGTTPMVTHSFMGAGSFTVTLSVLDNANLTGTTSLAVTVGVSPVLVALDMNPSTPNNIDSFGVFQGSFSVNVDVSNVTSLYGWQFQLSYNYTFLSTRAANITFGPFWTAAAASNRAFLLKQVNQTAGTIILAATLIGTAPTFTGFGTLATISFAAKPSGRLTLHLSNVVLVDSNGRSIPNLAEDGYAVVDIPPVAVLHVSPTQAAVGQPVSFDATSSFDPDGTLSVFFLNFGDEGFTRQRLTQHSYNAPGNYTAMLTVIDDVGLEGNATVLIRVWPASQDIPPIAEFTFSPDIPNAAQVVSFDGSKSTDPDGTIVFWNWNFGDGLTIGRNSPTVNHEYEAPGNYTVVLTVTDNASLTGSATEVVHVESRPFTKVAVDTNSNTPQVENFTATNGSFKVNVDVLNVTGMYAWQFSLHYDNTLLSTSEGDITVGPVWQASLSNGNGFMVVKVEQTTGTLEVAFTFVGEPANVPTFNGNAVLASILFTALKAGTGTLHIDTSPDATILLNSLPVKIPFTSQDGLVQVASLGDKSPVVLFAFSPSNPTVGETVFFDGTASFDPDGFIQSYSWSFSDGNVFFGEPTVSRFFNSPGNYSVTLTVTDNAGLSSTLTKTFVVMPKPAHDVAIFSLDVSPRVVVSSQTVGIQVGIINKGTSNETVSLTAYYDHHVITTIDGIFLQACDPNCFLVYINYFPIPWDTSGVSPGNYTISATVFLATDQSPSDNTMPGGKVEILPPPVLQANPSSGSLGSKVLVQGSGFPSFQSLYGPSISFIDVTFDDQFVGFTFSHGGVFNFTFNVPLAQPGTHLIKAIDQETGAHASTSFLVTQPPSGNDVGLSVNTGTIYFPGDTAVIYALATLNGSPTGPSGVQLQLILVRPNGSNVTLQATSVAPGVFKATFTVPTTGSVGTYVVMSHIHVGTGDASAIASFEVKPSWLASHGQTVGAIAAVAGVIGIVGVAWRKGYLRKREEDSLSSL